MATRFLDTLFLFVVLITAVGCAAAGDEHAARQSPATVSAATGESVVAESSVSLEAQRWDDFSNPWITAPDDLYAGPFPSSGRPGFLDDVVTHESLSNAVGVRNSSTSGGGHGFSYGGLMPAESVRSPWASLDGWRPLPQNEFRLAAGEVFSVYLPIATLSADETTFLISAIVDYEQVEFEMDGMTGRLHEVRMVPGKMLLLPVSFGVMPPGAHDVQVVIIADPYAAYGRRGLEDALLTNEGFGMLSVHAVGQRARVVVGDSEEPARQFNVLDIGSTPPVGAPVGSPLFFARRGDAHPYDSASQLRVDEAEAGAVYDFRTLTSRYPIMGDAVHVLMLFIDYRMTPLNDEGFFVVDLEAGEEAVIDTSIVLPDAPGDHQLTGMVVYDPYRRLDGEYFEQLEIGYDKVVINTR